MVVTIVTTNPERASLLAGCVHAVGLETNHVATDLVEPQHDAVAEIARAKAAAALRHAAPPVLVEDSGLAIDRLGGFPGPYLKYVLATLGPQRLISLVGGAPCRFISAIALADTAGRVDVLELELAGTITSKLPDRRDVPEIWRLVVPPGETRPFAELPPETAGSHLGAWTGRVIDWLSTRLGV